jgi:hypothetical protein
VAYAPFSNSKVQLGREVTPGTSVAATAVWRGEFAMLMDDRERVIVQEQIGAFTQAERSYDGRYGATWAQPSTPLTFEQVLHILEAGIKTATPSGSGPYNYTYAYPFTGTSVNTIKTYTIRAGSATVSSDIRETEFSFVEDFELSGTYGEAWMMQSNWRGRQLTASSYTGALTVPTVEEAIFSKTNLYIDATGGTIGTTLKAGVLVGASVKVKTGLIPVPVANGQLYFHTYKWTQPEITFSLTVELEDTVGLVTAERAFYESHTVRLIRLSCAGTSDRAININIAGVYDSVGGYENSDGNTTVTLEGHVVASSADSLSFSVAVANNLAAVP